MVKSLAWQSLDNSLADHLQLERHGIADSMGTEDLAKRASPAFFAGETARYSPAAEAAGVESRVESSVTATRGGSS